MSDTPTNLEKDLRAAAALGVALRCSDDALHRALEISAAIERRNPDAGFTPALTGIRASIRDVVEILERLGA